ncbi:MAG: radical SAM protein [Candidatus Pacebacteria bacterium]|nr:radical SAM protein [Candidatus Paceibacterota bacterium]
MIVKNIRTGAVIRLNSGTFSAIQKWLQGSESSLPQEYTERLFGENAFLVPCDFNELNDYKENFIYTRNEKANLFSLYFLPTTRCQFSCFYCFEEKSNSKDKDMTDGVMKQSAKWISDYFDVNKEVGALRFILFGGESLLRKDIIRKALPIFKSVATENKKDFWTEIITNGELLDSKIAETLSKYNWKRVQITLDGTEKIHNSRRFGKGRKPSFAKIIENIKMLLEKNYIKAIDLRISFDKETSDSIPEIIYFLGGLGYQERIKLSIGLITPSIDTSIKSESQEIVAEKTLKIWSIAKKEGFAIPDEFMVGPWCVAIAKHSAVLQPNGAIQKCFCTVGKNKYDFDSVFNPPISYTKDQRFEMFNRTDDCIKEECIYLPVCGGGCLYNSIVAYGDSGFQKRFCQKILLDKTNKGLLKLNYA